MLSVRYEPRRYNEEQLLLRESLETAVRRVGGSCEMAASLGFNWCSELVVRESPASKVVNPEAEEAMALEAVTRRQRVKTEKTQYVICRVSELATALQLLVRTSCVSVQ
jgi:hypothetical protein